MVFTGQKHLASQKKRGLWEGRGRGGEAAEGFVSIRSNGLSFFNVFTERVENQRTPASKGEREKTKTNKSCEKPLVHVLVLGMQNRLVEFFSLCFLNVPLFWVLLIPFAKGVVFGWSLSSSKLWTTSQCPHVLCSDDH